MNITEKEIEKAIQEFIIKENELIDKHCQVEYSYKLRSVLHRTMSETKTYAPMTALQDIVENGNMLDLLQFKPNPVIAFDYFARTLRLHLLKDFNPYFIKCFSDDTEEMNTAYLYFQLFLEESRTEHSERFMNAFFADVTDNHYFATESIIKAFVKTLNRMPTSQELINFQPSNI